MSSDKKGGGLPSGWVTTTLGEAVNYGQAVKVEPGDISPEAWILELEDIERDSSKIIQRLSFLERVSKSTKNRFEAGDVLYGKLRPYLNKVVLSDSDGYCTTEIVPIKSSVHLDSRYTFYWLKSQTFLNYVANVSHGMNMPRLGTDAGRQAPFLLPPLPEQVRIADKLDTLLSRASSGRERLERMQKLLKQFRQSVLNAAVSGELTREWRGGGDAEWDDLKLRDCATDFSYGSSAKSDKVGAIPVLRMGNIQRGELDWEDLVFTSDPVEIEKYRLQNGDVLFNRTNSPDLVGKTAIFRGQRDAIYAGYLIRIRTAPTLLPEFLNYCLNSQYGRDYCWMVKTDGVSQSNINAQKLRDFPIALPPLPEQAEIVRRVESLFALADSLEERYAQTVQAFETLTPALLGKAFRGELVPQDPNDEPASVLLERIRAEQAVKAKKPKQSRKTSGETGAGGTGKRGRPRKDKAASEDSLFADVPQAKNLEEAIALLEAKKARKRLQMLQEGLEVATRQGRRLGMADLHRQYRSAFPDDDVSAFYSALKQLPDRLIAEAVQQETMWETTSAD